jgi:FkbM family methyltransferase
MRLASVRGHHIWPAPLTKDSVVVDAGAHRGEFSAEIIRRFGCQCHLIEANPELAKNLTVAGAASITTAALGACDGRGTLHVSENLEAGGLFDAGSATTSVEVETISLATLMTRLRITKIDILKLDIEGAEFDLIASTPDQTVQHISQITVEFHDFKPAFRGRGLFENARERLIALGFICCNMAFRTHGDVLFLNRGRTGLCPWQLFYAQWFARYDAKLRRSLRCKDD